jgi:hypothetical protein
VRLVTALNKFISVHFLHRYAELFRFIFVSNQPNFASSCQDSFGVSTVVTYSCSVHECTTLDSWQNALHPFAVGLTMFALQIGARNFNWISCNARRTPMLPAYVLRSAEGYMWSVRGNCTSPAMKSRSSDESHAVSSKLEYQA